MEFQVVAKKEKGSDAKIDFHIFGAGVTVGGSGKGADERTQKVKLMLTPVFVDDDGKRRKVDISRSSESEKQQSQKFTLDRP